MPHKTLHKIEAALGLIWATILLISLSVSVVYTLWHGAESTVLVLQEFTHQIKDATPGGIYIIFAILCVLRLVVYIPIVVPLIWLGLSSPLHIAYPYAILITSISGMLTYGVVMFFAEEFRLRDRLPERATAVIKSIARRPFTIPLVLFMIPIVPPDLIFVTAGIARSHLGWLMAAYLVSTPAVLLPYIALGESLESGNSLGWTGFVFVALLLFSLYAWRHPHYQGVFAPKQSRKKSQSPPRTKQQKTNI